MFLLFRGFLAFNFGFCRDILLSAPVLEPSWGQLGAIMGLSWAILGPSWAILGHLGAILGTILGTSWSLLGPLGATWGHLGATLGHLGAILDHKVFVEKRQKPYVKSRFSRLGALLGHL